MTTPQTSTVEQTRQTPQRGIRATPTGIAALTTPARRGVEFVYAGARPHPLPHPMALTVERVLRHGHEMTRRITASTWIRYLIDLRSFQRPADAIRLTPIDPDVLALVDGHPDAALPELQSALTYWNRGLRGGYVWLDGNEPLCMQWLFTSADNAALRRLGTWSGMYPPIVIGTGQVEKLWTFSTARQKRVATRFAEAMFCVAREKGLSGLRTHIHGSNAAARSWALRTGWTAYGTITRYGFDLPGLRHDDAQVFVHERRAVPAPSAV